MFIMLKTVKGSHSIMASSYVPVHMLDSNRLWSHVVTFHRVSDKSSQWGEYAHEI